MVKLSSALPGTKRQENLADQLDWGQHFCKPNQNLARVAFSKTQKLCLPSMRGLQVVDLDPIIYLEASSNYTYLHFADRPSICTAKSILEFEEIFADSQFVRIHRSFIINLDHVQEYVRHDGGYVILSAGHKVEVARRKREMLMARLKGYYESPPGSSRDSTILTHPINEPDC